MVIELLNSLGIQAKNDERKNKVLIRDFKNMKKFKDIIGFIDGVTITKNSKVWKNFEKTKFWILLLKPLKCLNLLPKVYGQDSIQSKK
jgi:hypothetical protein